MQNDYIDLKQVARIVWRRKFVVFLCAFIGFCLGGFYSFRVAESSFQAKITLRFELANDALPSFDSLLSGTRDDYVALNTELHFMRSRELVTKLVERLDLVQDPEFNTRLAEPSGLQLRALIMNAFGVTASSEPLSAEVQAARDLRNTLSRVRNAITVTPQVDTYLLDVAVVSADPAKAVLLANTLGEVYIEEQKAQKFEDSAFAINWLSERARELEQELREKENEATRLRSESDLINREGLQGLDIQVKDFRDRLERSTADLVDAEVRQAELAAIAAASDIAIAARALRDPLLIRLLNSAASEDRDQALRDRIVGLQADAVALVARNKAEVDSFTQALERVQAQFSQQSAELLALEQLDREIAVTRNLYESFLSGLQETTVRVGLVRSDASIMSRAIPPRGAFSPHHTANLALSILIGTLAGGVLIFILESLNRGFNSPDELAAEIDLPVLGSIPPFPSSKREAIKRHLVDKPTSFVNEAVRNLRTSILMADPQGVRVIVVTSSIPGEGKTTLSLSLATNFAAMGKRVLLIEGDLRRRTLNNYFAGLDTRIGSDMLFDETLSDQQVLSDAIQQSDLPGLDVLFGQKTSENAADLLSSPLFAQRIEAFAAAYDHVVIDCPPVLVVPDARIIGRLADTILFGVKWQSSVRSQVLAGLDQIKGLTNRNAGVVMTQVSPKGLRKYGYHSGYGGYGGYRNKYYER